MEGEGDWGRGKGKGGRVRGKGKVKEKGKGRAGKQKGVKSFMKKYLAYLHPKTQPELLEAWPQKEEAGRIYV